jgi:hypothetical protein
MKRGVIGPPLVGSSVGLLLRRWAGCLLSGRPRAAGSRPPQCFTAVRLPLQPTTPH